MLNNQAAPFRPARLALIALAIIILLLQSGCWGSQETDEVAFVLSMGFDKGERDNLIVTFNIANPRAMTSSAPGGGAGGSGSITLVGSVEATAPVSALDLMNSATTRRLSLLHTKAYIFSEELARDGLAKWLTPLNRLPEFRETASVYIVRGKAKDFLKNNQPLLEISPSKQFELIAQISNFNSFFMPTQFYKFYEKTKIIGTESTLPIIGIHEGGLSSTKPGPTKGGNYEVGPYLAGEVPIEGKNITQFIGTAMFKRDKMIGTLNGTETRSFLLLLGQFNKATINLPDPIAGPEYFIGLKIKQGRSPEYHSKITTEGRVIIDINLFVEADIAAISSGINYENHNKTGILEKSLNQIIEKKANDLIEKCQENDTDILGFGNHIKKHFLTRREWEDFNWPERFKDVEVNIKAHTSIRRTGLQIKTTGSGAN
ncbi:germination protein, Ger(x)C family [Desulfofarcimen acetoxidans DSM 771]|uniref:Germination protein, Ger(X)C family n=1 Tax=Desulfofarcimen acetoxidans (strain ATCC 49208 / DSM 771 / KCTC 5769 / VKM B-1644 / 5575) TaxID=485916 RepID=C8W2M6_DESAS|nr:Ger(x)C family spore germination protein [Desulfofarcimen acetoxidans]ACV63710.1 germination protein, Ger(x)C family [Desulfofarcimen acetoxidans DSM 771]